ncbi:acyl carrier protein [Streptomyces sp. BBFR2]|uniref:acyl carrier protein n=1 Tax=Streptomyces sp. BBFR2 TaxID=3372854 RepID=UPI0037D9D3EB
MSDFALLQQVRQIWAEVLDQDQEEVPVDVNFFEAGGDSLLFIVLLERLNRLAGSELEAAELFDYATVQAQAEYLAASGEPTAPAGAVPAAN